MNWTVYKHISPSGKVYIGISSNVKNRWAANGYYYHLSDTIFSRALHKYGWDNFQHIIIQTDLTKEEACDMEKELIAYYKAKKISYNITDGGEGFTGKHSEQHIRNRVKSRIANSDTDYLVIDKDFNYIICNTQKEAAEFLKGKQNNISRILNQPIGYTFRGHYIWKHKKGTEIDIDFIKSQIEKALKLRYQRMSIHMKEVSNKMIINSKLERQTLSEDQRKIRYISKGMLGKQHSEVTRNKMSESAKHRKTSKETSHS